MATAGDYSILIEWSETDGVYLATLPEFPNARTHGATRAEALAMGESLLDDLIAWAAGEGETLPPARTFDRHFYADPPSAPSPSVLIPGQRPQPGNVYLSGDEDADALPYQETTVRAAITAVPRR